MVLRSFLDHVGQTDHTVLDRKLGVHAKVDKSGQISAVRNRIVSPVFYGRWRRSPRLISRRTLRCAQRKRPISARYNCRDADRQHCGLPVHTAARPGGPAAPAQSGVYRPWPKRHSPARPGRDQLVSCWQPRRRRRVLRGGVAAEPLLAPVFDQLPVKESRSATQTFFGACWCASKRKLSP